MTHNIVDEQWERLCKQHDKARDAYASAYADLVDRFGQLSGQHIDQHKQAWNLWQEVMQKMEDYARKHGL